MNMNRLHKFAALLATLVVVAGLALAPDDAQARAGGSYYSGGGSSFTSQGSRGGRTYNYNGGAPVQRSLTPQQTPYYGGQPGYGYGSFAARHPFLTGIAGGFFGSWIGSLLFPHWGGYGYGYGGGFGVLSSLFTWLLIIGVVWFVIRLFRGPRIVSAPDMGYGGGYAPSSYATGGMLPGGYGAPDSAPLAIAQADYQAFETILKGIQAAWSNGDLNALRRFTTPEMLSYFSEELAENQSRGVVNHVENVELLRGDLREAWDEGNLHYATTYLQWRALDYTVRDDGGPAGAQTVVDGDVRQPTVAAELWTFARTPGGQWLLSAIQQV
jgi:predicted lipid-binding transport protein (Tim44 family)